ncbi:hypothetical protein WSS15_30110 [Acetobacter pasteurianus]|uniref:hypothetical protein n=1 Tax=Acetobacter pasteurianus TaxID=438 RepID=UPI0022BE0BC2|nr:hypothetical protein [Acetobacter pasteurianus]GLH30361.1 hypothetical protein WSS15_30110 [Acetobacter pasteurianus]
MSLDKIDASNATTIENTHPHRRPIVVVVKARSQNELKQKEKRCKWLKCLDLVAGFAMLGGPLIHEFGHYLVAKYFTKISPVQIWMVSPIASMDIPDKYGKVENHENIIKKYLKAFFTCEVGVTWYAGSKDDDGFVWWNIPNDPNIHIFSQSEPGYDELRSARGGPAAQILWVFILAATAIIIYVNFINRHWEEVHNLLFKVIFIITCIICLGVLTNVMSLWDYFTNKYYPNRPPSDAWIVNEAKKKIRNK